MKKDEGRSEKKERGTSKERYEKKKTKGEPICTRTNNGDEEKEKRMKEIEKKNFKPSWQ